MKYPLLITSSKNWIEHTAVMQLNALSELDGVRKVAGLPDLHAGKVPVGVAVVTEGMIYPHIIGNDIGCGMGLFRTGIERKKLKWIVG
ncbi:RtcB family protein [Petroclostridium sp. X23]|uniref:RtcB family protein n=1 Tax=Petroclostridium sp. X23 TaxID=3045146 RepID=UPI0024AD7D01|nr:RtcB family protein [Petroclostridium sp. X23]WHH58571.1 RtcB family protein [Petroclostridium sp. X23]